MTVHQSLSKQSIYIYTQSYTQKLGETHPDPYIRLIYAARHKLTAISCLLLTSDDTCWNFSGIACILNRFYSSHGIFIVVVVLSYNFTAILTS